MAKLLFRYGVMGSAKTLNLLTTAYQFDDKGIPCLVFKPSTDTRGESNVIQSRIKSLKRECISIHPETDIFNFVSNYRQFQQASMEAVISWILVDEAQFLSEKQIDELAEVVDKLGINVICYGLRTDFRSQFFPGSKRLMEIADSIEEIKASCQCGKKATINARIDENGRIITDGSQILIGGDEQYVGLCRKCWNKLKEEQILS